MDGILNDGRQYHIKHRQLNTVLQHFVTFDIRILDKIADGQENWTFTNDYNNISLRTNIMEIVARMNAGYLEINILVALLIFLKFFIVNNIIGLVHIW